MPTRSGKKITIISAEAVRAQLKALDDARSEEFRRNYPIYPMELLVEKFPDKWLAILITEHGAGLHGIATGRLIRYSSNRNNLWSKVTFLKLRYPDLYPTILYTGPYNFGGDIIA